MPRSADDAHALARDLQTHLERLVAAARQQGRDEALAQIRNLVGGARAGAAAGAVRRGPGRPKGSKNKPKPAGAKKPRAKRRSSWAGLTPEQKLARVNAIRKGRGLPLKEKL